MAVKMITKKIPLVYPGEVLYEDWLIPLGMSQFQLAKVLRISPSLFKMCLFKKLAHLHQLHTFLFRALLQSLRKPHLRKQHVPHLPPGLP